MEQLEILATGYDTLSYSRFGFRNPQQCRIRISHILILLLYLDEDSVFMIQRITAAYPS